MDKHIRRGHPILFGLIFFFGIIELAISAWLTSRFRSRHDYNFPVERDRTSFVLFTSIWTVLFFPAFLVLFQLVAESIFNTVLVYGIFLFVTWIFWTAAAAAVTEMTGGHLNCAVLTRLVYCGQLNAMEAFAWIIWFLVTLSLVVVIIKAIAAARAGDGAHSRLVAA